MTNGVKDDVNGTNKCNEDVIGDICKGIPNLEDIPCKVEKACEEIIKDGKGYLKRRSVNAFGTECDYDSIINKWLCYSKSVRRSLETDVCDEADGILTRIRGKKVKENMHKLFYFQIISMLY